MTSNRTLDSPNVHLIITEPSTCPSRSFIHAIRSNCYVSTEVDGKEITEFRIVCKDLLLPGGHVVIFLPFY